MMEFPFVPSTSPRYLSIDGGTSTAGLCYYEITSDGVLRVLDTHLLDVRNEDINYTTHVIRYGALDARLKRMQDGFNDYLDRLSHLPCVVYYESHFINPRRPTSVIPLVRFMQVVANILMNNQIIMITVAPQQMKKQIGVTGKISKADKDAVKKAVIEKIKTGRIIYDKDIDLISEHEIDAIGIGYTGAILDGLIQPEQH